MRSIVVLMLSGLVLALIGAYLISNGHTGNVLVISTGFGIALFIMTLSHAADHD